MAAINRKLIGNYVYDYMRDLVSMTATTATRTGLRSASGLSYWKPRIRTKFGEYAFSYSGTRNLSICRQLLTLTLSSVYLKLIYLSPPINYLIAFYRLCINDCVMCAGQLCKSSQNCIVCMYVCTISARIHNSVTCR